ncbi:MAG: DNA repair protein RecN [Nevskiaceae bacterium]|nr:MAG: DNA repair protein RecN [Nevskiaceae bacterium]TBR71538.1 MAG: DNA repair protein RecN [Nevskiaceae bacterium]
MLRHLAIRNLALVEQLEIDFSTGLTVLTGETGAGKSILIDAIGLVLGARADATLVRNGAAHAEVSAEFELEAGNADMRGWLRDHALDDDNDPACCVLRRTLQAEGRTRAFINDRPVSATALRELGERLVEIFGQGESRTLVQADVQRNLLDAGGDYAVALDTTAVAATVCRTLAERMDALRGAGSRDPAQVDYLRFQVEELRTLNAATDEAEALALEQQRLAHADELLSQGGAAHEALYGGDHSLYDQLAAVGTTLGQLARLQPPLEGAASLIGDAQALVREAADTVNAALDQAELDPDRLHTVEQRMAALHDMARKHHVAPAMLPARQAELETELTTLETAGEALGNLQKEHAQALQRYRAAAAQLTVKRRAAAAKLATRVTQRIRALAMPDATLSISVAPNPDAPPSASGDDTVRFDFTANPGQPPQPLAKIASGGELSRISLALQVAVEDGHRCATMIFDEIDTGIGGPVAETVGAQLAALGRSAQVLCVTHLAQVAAQGAQHLFITKRVQGGQTYTSVQPLDPEQRVHELARMAGGRTITTTTEAHARELLARARQ